MKNGL